MKKISSFFGLIACSVLFSQSFNKAKMDEFMNVLDENQKMMGTIAVAKDSKIVYSKSIGFADVENKNKNSLETKFRIGSVSKIFTAVLVMKAVEEGQLKLDDKLSKFYPEIKNSEKITIEHLLNHRSGIHNVTDLPDYLSWNQDYKTPAQIIEKIKEGGSDFEPGAEMSYSNSGYILLSYILENVNKKPFSKILEEKIVKPLGLKNTYYGGKIDIKKGEANSYEISENIKKEEETDPSIPSGAGALVSNAEDLLKFIQNLFANKVISANSLAQMTKMTDNYCYGIFAVPFHDLKGFGHTGGIDGFTSEVFYFPTSKLAYVRLSNGANFETNTLGIAALSAATGKDFEIPNFKTVAVSEADLKKLEGTYATSAFPLKINVFVKDGKLFGQATGQGEFPLEAKSSTKFEFTMAGIEMEFVPEKKEMNFSQMGNKMVFTKE